MNKRTIAIVNALLFGLLFFILTWGVGSDFSSEFDSFFQYKKNLKANDNSLNWVNYNYGKNFLMGMEPNSIFMTEGGDNQVFSLLYFALVENKRPDVDFFDQKGNVFPRLYGDILNTSARELSLVQDIRDFQLYSTDRPVYVTWRRANIEKLSLSYLRNRKNELFQGVNPQFKAVLDRKYQLNNLDGLKRTARNYIDRSIYDLKLRSGGYLYEQDFKYLGPWYLKQFGLAFKVTPFRYAIVDALDIHGGRGDYASLQETIAAITKINMSVNQFNLYTRQLASEGYLSFSENDFDKTLQLALLKPFDEVFKGITALDYWNKYKIFYKDVYNSYAWDFLTLEIYAYYARYQRSQYLTQVNFLKRKINFAPQGEKEGLLAMINEYTLKSEEVVEENLAFNPNNVALHYYVGSVNFNKDPEKSAKHLAKINEIDYKNTRWSLTAAKIIYQHSLKNQNENYLENLQKAKGYLDKLLESKRTFYRSRNSGGYEQDKEVVEASKIMAVVDEAILNAEKNTEFSRDSSADEEKIVNQIGNDKEKLVALVKNLESNKQFTLAEKIYNRLLASFPDDEEVFGDYVNFLRENNLDKAVTVLNEVIETEKYSQALSEDKVKFFLGKLHFEKAEKNSGTQKSIEHYEKSRVFFNDYLALVNEKTSIDSKTKNQIIISEKSISHIDLVLSKR